MTTFGPTLAWDNPVGTTQVHLEVLPFGNDGPGVNAYLGSPASSLQIPPPPHSRGTPYNHWVLYNIPPDVRTLPQDVPKVEVLADGTLQGTNEAGRIGYLGPCPQRGRTNTYRFFLYALSEPLPLAPRPTKEEAQAAIEERTLAAAHLDGRYARP